MNKSTRFTLAIVLLALSPVGLAAQETTVYSANPLRLDLRMLGHRQLARTRRRDRRRLHRGGAMVGE